LATDATPRGLSFTETPAGVQLSWYPPEEATLAIAGYRVFRITFGSNSNYHELTNAPIAAQSFLDASAVAGTTYDYVVVAVNAANQTSEVSGLLSATEIWDPLWAIHDGMNEKGQFEIVNATVSLGKYKMAYTESLPVSETIVLRTGEVTTRKNYTKRKIKITTLDEWNTAYRFQYGYVDYRFRIEIKS
jgi:hypothetical protein